MIPEKLERLVECSCGCGAVFTDTDSRGRKREYVSGHNTPTGGRLKKAKPLSRCSFCGGEFITSSTGVLRKNRGSNSFCSAECRAKFTGRKLSNDWEYREKMRRITLANGNRPPRIAGPDHWNWKGGKAKRNAGSDYEYCKWRRDVLSAGMFTCALCGQYGGKLSAHHLDSWSEFPELRYERSNGICLCFSCHMTIHGLRRKEDAVSDSWKRYLPQEGGLLVAETALFQSGGGARGAPVATGC